MTTSDSSKALFEHLWTLEKQLHSFEVRSDEKRISDLLSPNFYEFGSSGNTWSRSDILSRLPAEDDKTKIDAFDFNATLLSKDVVLITYISRRDRAGAATTEFKRSSIWKYNGLSWQMEFHQGTPAALSTKL